MEKGLRLALNWGYGRMIYGCWWINSTDVWLKLCCMCHSHQCLTTCGPVAEFQACIPCGPKLSNNAAQEDNAGRSEDGKVITFLMEIGGSRWLWHLWVWKVMHLEGLHQELKDIGVSFVPLQEKNRTTVASGVLLVRSWLWIIYPQWTVNACFM